MARLAEIALFTADVPRLIEFYERVLGIQPRSRSESHAYFDSDGSGHYYASYAEELRGVANPVPSLCQWLAPLTAQVLPTG